MWTWLANVFNSVIRGIEALGTLIADLGAAMVALVTQAGTILGLLVNILWQMANVAGSLVSGLLSTLRSATSPAFSWGAVQDGASQMGTALGLQAIGYMLAGLVWIIVALAIIKVVQGRHG